MNKVLIMSVLGIYERAHERDYERENKTPNYSSLTQGHHTQADSPFRYYRLLLYYPIITLIS